jgi:hypothetical protein
LVSGSTANLSAFLYHSGIVLITGSGFEMLLGVSQGRLEKTLIMFVN